MINTQEKNKNRIETGVQMTDTSKYTTCLASHMEPHPQHSRVSVHKGTCAGEQRKEACR